MSDMTVGRITFTPGPWRVEPDLSNIGKGGVTTANNEVEFAINDGEAAYMRIEDARLIAAAPELLAACQLLIRFCSNREGTLNAYEEWLECFVEDGSTITEVVEKAVAAIAKAEGR